MDGPVESSSSHAGAPAATSEIAGSPLRHQGPNSSPMRIMRRLLGERKGLFLGNLALRLVKDLLPFQGPILVGIAVDLLSGSTGRNRNLLGFELTQNDVRSIIIVAVFMAVLAVAKTVIGYVHTIVSAHMGRHVVQAARRDLANAAMQMSLDERRRFNSGDLLDRCLADSKGLRSFTQNVIIRVISNTVRAVFPVAFMFMIDPILAIVVLAVIPLQSSFSGILQRRLQRQTRDARSREATHTSAVKEAIDGWNNVASVGGQDWAAQGIHDTAAASEDAKIVKKHTTAAISAVITLCTALGIAAVYAIGGWRIISTGALDGSGTVAEGALTLGTLTAFIGVAKKTYAPFQAYTKIVSSYRTGLVNLERIADVLDAPMIDPRDDGPKLKVQDGTVSLSNVGFTYGGDAHATLSSLNGDIPGRSMTVITGSSGAGKTTLLRLLLGLDIPTTGTVSIDNQDINVANFASLQQVISLVPQEPVLFTGTLRENLLLGRDDIPNEQLVEACARAGLGEMISELPFGLDTKVGSGRHMLSGGQLRRTAIARALLRKPSVLLLDEPTTGLDLENSRLILNTLRGISDHTTVIMVSHRSEPLKASDYHLVLSDGGWKRSEQHVYEAIEPSPESLAAIARAGGAPIPTVEHDSQPAVAPSVAEARASATADGAGHAFSAAASTNGHNGSTSSNSHNPTEPAPSSNSHNPTEPAPSSNGHNPAAASPTSTNESASNNAHETPTTTSNGSNGSASNNAHAAPTTSSNGSNGSGGSAASHSRIENEAIALSAMGRPIALNALTNPEAAVRVLVVSGHRAIVHPISDFTAALFDHVVGDQEALASLATIDDVNPDGGTAPRRLNALGIDLEADHAVMSAPETKAIHRTLDWLQADITLDIAEHLVGTESDTDVSVVIRFVPDANQQPSATVMQLAREVRNQLDRSSYSYTVTLAGCLPGSLTAARQHTVVELTSCPTEGASAGPALREAIVATYRAAAKPAHGESTDAGVPATP